MEVLDIYDENCHMTGRTFTRGKDELKEGEYFIFIQTFVFDNEGRMLLTKRNENKKCGGMWEGTNGHALAGEEGIDAMQRELKEEIGLDIKKEDLVEYDTIKKGKAFRKVWTTKGDYKKENLTYTDDEVVDAKFVTREELKQMIQEGIIVPNNEYILDVFDRVNK